MAQLNVGDKVKLSIDIEEERKNLLGMEPRWDFSKCKNVELTIEMFEESQFVEGKGFVKIMRLKGANVIELESKRNININELLIPSTGVIKI